MDALPLEQILGNCKQIYERHKLLMREKFHSDFSGFEFKKMKDKELRKKSRMALNFWQKIILVNPEDFGEDYKQELTYCVVHECLHSFLTISNPELYPAWVEMPDFKYYFARIFKKSIIEKAEAESSKYFDVEEAAADILSISYLRECCKLGVENANPLEPYLAKKEKPYYLGGCDGNPLAYARLKHIFEKNGYQGVLEALKDPEALRKPLSD